VSTVLDMWLVATHADLGGHDIDDLVDALDAAWACENRPSVISAYTIKGWSLPFAGDAMNHSALLSADQPDFARRHQCGRTPSSALSERFTYDAAVAVARQALVSKRPGRELERPRRHPRVPC
jgi:pyruvate dehydrogenase E1 component